ncbi:aminotransferase class V-fold PLP-dependent enzyme [Dictyobacter kobayashii]|uniref:Cysteine lyase n=1 Tax=Dictyobacter kobayashii TaxID=2014872 RepID=A0A402ABL4_9CHLR|nr:aminotransferase class V-fold PLP-dependent enzyme [Dictyobacter kobayashii]GCE16489.1 cysteine lyase [Dictyobacter kobayashii]
MVTLAHLQEIRSALPATTTQIYLNTGTFGPLPACVPQAITARIQEEWQQGRLGPAGFGSITTISQQAREHAARLLHCQTEEISLTDNTGEGMNIVSYGINWQAGDEVITTNHEHISALAPLYQIRDRSGIVVRVADLGPRANQSARDAIEKLITPRTRLISLSHVTWTTGAILDVQEVAALGRAHNIPVLIDGAQSAGNIPIDVTALGVDFYAIPMQKWLCGPDGTGALYVRQESLHYIQSTYVGYNSAKFGPSPNWELHDHAQRFEVGGRQTAAISGQSAVLHWLETVVGYEWLFARIKELNNYAYQTLKEIPDLTILTPEPGHSGILTFTIADTDEVELVTYLREMHNIAVRSIPDNKSLRISTGFFNTESEIDTLAHALLHRK